MKHSHFGSTWDEGLHENLHPGYSPADLDDRDPDALTPEEYAGAIDALEFALDNWEALDDHDRAMATELADVLEAEDARDAVIEQVADTLDGLHDAGHSNATELFEHYAKAGFDHEDALEHTASAAEYIGSDAETNRDLTPAIDAFVRERHILGHGDASR